MRPPADRSKSTGVAPKDFLVQFRRELTNRLHRWRVFNLGENIQNHRGTVEIEIVLTDEAGTRIGGGTALVESLGTSPESAMKGAESGS